MMIAPFILVGLILTQATGVGKPEATAATANAIHVVETAEAKGQESELTTEERAILSVLSQLASSDETIASRGVSAAQQSGDSFYDGPLRWMLAAELPSSVRANAAAALGVLDWPTTELYLDTRIESLGAAAESSSIDVRHASLLALGAYPVPKAITLLRRHQLQEGDEAVVNRALVNMKSSGVMRQLSAWLTREPSAVQQEKAVRCPLAVAAQTILTAPHTPWAENVIGAILAAPDKDLLRPIAIFAARHGGNQNRMAVLTDIQRYPLHVDVPFLIELLEHKDPATQEATLLALAQHSSVLIARSVANFMTTSQSSQILKTAASVLRQQQTEALVEVLPSILRATQGYALELLAFIVRERSGRSAVWPKTLAWAADQSDHGLEAILSESLTDRRLELIPKLSDSTLTEAELVAALRALTGVADPLSGNAVLATMTPVTSAQVLRAAGDASKELSDGQLIPHLQALIPQIKREQRRAIYDVLKARESAVAGRALIAAVRDESDAELFPELLAKVDPSDSEALAAVVSRLRTTENPEIVYESLSSLEGRNDEHLAPVLLALVRRFNAGPTDPGWYRVRELACARLTRLEGDGADKAVRTLANDAKLEVELRLTALRSLTDKGNRDDVPMLESMLEEEDADIRTAARDALHNIAPDLYPEWDQLGRWPLVITTAALGTTLLVLSTEIAQRSADANIEDVSKVLVGVTGAALGGGTTWLLTLDSDVSLGEAGYVASMGVWGTLGGYSLPRVTGLTESSPSAAMWGAIAGELVGLGMGGLTMRSSRFALDDAILTNLVAASLGAGGISAWHLARADSQTAAAGDAFVLGAVAGTLPMLLLSPYLDINDDLLAIATSIGFASWIGGFAPLALYEKRDRRDYDTLAGIGLGQAVGLTGGLLLSQVTDLDGESVWWATLGGLAGAGLGAGVGKATPNLDKRWTYGLLEAGTLAGAGMLAWLGPKLDFEDNDIGLILLMTGGGALVGGRLPERLADQEQNATDDELWGGALVGGTLGLFGGLAMSQFADVSGGELLMTGSAAAVFGTGFAGLRMLEPDLIELKSPIAGAAAAIGILGLGAFVTPKLEYEPADLGLGISTASLGAFLGAWVPAYTTDEGTDLVDSEQAGGAMLGGALGLMFAGTVSQFADIDARRVLRIDVGSLGGMAAGAGLGLLLPPSASPDFDRQLTVALMQGGTVAGYAIATLTERHSEYDWADRAHMGLGAALGAYHGSLIPYLWRDPNDPREAYVPDTELGGGALLGLGIGGIASRLAVKLQHKDAADVAEVALFDAFGSAVGLAVSGYAEGEDRRTRFGILEGVGLGAWIAGEILANRTEYTARDNWMIGTLSAAGAVGGLGLPYLFFDDKPTDTQIAGGAAFGVGALGLSSLGLAQFTEYEGDDLVEAMLVASVAAAGGWGIAGAHRDSIERRRIAAADAGWFGGLALGLATAPWTRTTEDDRWWIASGMLIGGWVGGLTPRLLNGEDVTDSRVLGGTAAGAAIAGLGTAGFLQFAEAPMEWAHGAMSVSLATTLTAGGLARMGVPADAKMDALSMQLAAIGGIGVAAIIAPKTNLAPVDYATIATFAGLGAWHGAFAASALEINAENAVDGGALAGAGTGMLLGYALSQTLDIDWNDDVEIVSDTAVGAIIGGSLGLMLDFNRADSARAIELGSLAGMGLGIGLSRFTEYPESSLPLLGIAGLWGAWHGLWLGQTLQPSHGDNLVVGGGTLFGLGTSVGAAAIVSQMMTVEFDELGEATVVMGAGDLLGAGVGKLMRLERGWQTALFEIGGVTGIAAGLALADRTTYSGTDVALIGMTSALGAGHGAMLGVMLADANGDLADSAWGGVMLGAGLGLGGGMALAQVQELESGDLVEIGLATLAGDAIGAGLGHWLRMEQNAHLGLVQAGGLGMAALALAFAGDTRFHQDDRILTLFATSYGGWMGGWAPVMWQDDQDELGADSGLGVVLGSGAGMLAGGIASQLTDYSLKDTGEIAFGAATTSVLGAGLGLLASPDTDLWVGLMEATSLAGTLGIATIAPDTTYSGSDAVLGTLAAIYGVYQGAGLSLLLDANDDQVAGAMMTAGAIGALGGSYLGKYLKLDGSDIWMLLAGSAWGVWIGIWTAAAVDQLDTGGQDNPFFLGVGTTAVATDATLVATSIAISKLVGMPPKQFAWISVAGGLGLVGGLLGSYLSGGDAMSPQMGIAVGSTGGLLIGTVITGFLDWEQPAYAVPPGYETSSSSSATAVLPNIAWWFPSVNVAPVGDQDGLSPVSGTQVLVTVTGGLQ